jgi:hypothetical protein
MRIEDIGGEQVGEAKNLIGLPRPPVGDPGSIELALAPIPFANQVRAGVRSAQSRTPLAAK